MAIWQIDLQLVLDTDERPSSPDNGWVPSPLPGDLILTAFEFLSEPLGAPWPMVKDWLVFGPENGNRVDVVFEPTDTAIMVVRFDVRSEGGQFTTLICRLARKLGCMLYSADTGEILFPEETSLAAAVDNVRNVVVLRNLNM